MFSGAGTAIGMFFPIAFTYYNHPSIFDWIILVLGGVCVFLLHFTALNVIRSFLV